MSPRERYSSYFISLAMSDMANEAICVAGIDPETLEWIRPVKQGYHCMFKQHLDWFPFNTVLEVPFSGKQPRSFEEDPYSLHNEDEVIAGRPEVISQLTATQKRDILDKATDKDLKKVIGTSERSLFLVQVKDFRCKFDDESDVRVEFQGGGVTTDALRNYVHSACSYIGISSHGLPCRARGWVDFTRPLRKGLYLEYEDILKMDPSAKVFFALSLSGLLHEKHWAILAGIHIVGEEIWL